MSNQNKKIYFASDFHLGAPNYKSSLIREKKIVDWLNYIESSAEEIFLVGDIFDFCYGAHPYFQKKFSKLGEALTNLANQGTKVLFFQGNHEFCLAHLNWPKVEFVKRSRLITLKNNNDYLNRNKRKDS